MQRTRPWALLGALSVLVGAVAPAPAKALPRPASGSNCKSDWVNNAGAMACFTKGEDEARAGAQHPHYVACLNGQIFCCVDNDRGQNCDAVEARPASDADRIRALLAAHKTRLMSLGRWTTAPKPAPPPSRR